MTLPFQMWTPARLRPCKLELQQPIVRGLWTLQRRWVLSIFTGTWFNLSCNDWMSYILYTRYVKISKSKTTHSRDCVTSYRHTSLCVDPTRARPTCGLCRPFVPSLCYPSSAKAFWRRVPKFVRWLLISPRTMKTNQLQSRSLRFIAGMCVCL